jgi:flagellar FliJ protein
MAKQKDLSVLIRLRKWDVDERQRALGVILREEEHVIARQQSLENSLVREREFVGKADPSQRVTFEAFVRRCIDARAALDQELFEVRKRIAVAQAELAEAYRRLKTFEISQKQRDAAEKKEEDRLEQINLDEIALTLHRRGAGGTAI